MGQMTGDTKTDTETSAPTDTRRLEQGLASAATETGRLNVELVKAREQMDYFNRRLWIACFEIDGANR